MSAKSVAIRCDDCGWGMTVHHRYAAERMRVHRAERCPKRVKPILKALRDDCEFTRKESL